MAGELEDARVVYIFKCEPGYGPDGFCALHEMCTKTHQSIRAITEKRTVIHVTKIAKEK